MIRQGFTVREILTLGAAGEEKRNKGTGMNDLQEDRTRDLNG